MSEAARKHSYILDACILAALQRSGHLDILVALKRHFDLVIIEEVYDELVFPRGNRHAELALAAKVAIEASVSVVSIEVMSPAAERLDALKAKSPRTGAGETASIAWAADHEEYTFVTRDAAAAYLALDELCGRARTFFHFLREAVSVGAIDRLKAKTIADAAEKADGVKASAPEWWPAWIAGQSQATETLVSE